MYGFVYWAKKFHSSSELFRPSCENCILCNPKDNLVRNKFIGNIIFLFSFGHWGKVFGFVSASFGWGSQNSNQSVQGNVLKKNCFFSQNCNFLIFFGSSTKSFRRFFRRFYAGSSVLHSTCSKVLFEDFF